MLDVAGVYEAIGCMLAQLLATGVAVRCLAMTMQPA